MRKRSGGKKARARRARPGRRRARRRNPTVEVSDRVLVEHGPNESQIWADLKGIGRFDYAFGYRGEDTPARRRKAEARARELDGELRRNPARRARRRNPPVPTIADELDAVTYRGGDGKRGQAFIHEYETGVQAIPVSGGEVELPDGSVLAVEPGSVLQRSRRGLPLWMEEET